MPHELIDGWLYGRLRGPKGRLIPVRRFPQPPFYRRQDARPDLVQHTTQVAEHYIPIRRYPTEWQVGIYQGQVIIGQHKPTWARGEATDEQDHHAVQIEIQADSRIAVWLPRRDILDALVALMAFLHRRGLVNTALKRPDHQSWPLRVDRLPAATDDYYRRKAGLWQRQPGVYGPHRDAGRRTLGSRRPELPSPIRDGQRRAECGRRQRHGTQRRRARRRSVRQRPVD